MIISQTKTLHKYDETDKTVPICPTCRVLATHAVFDYREVISLDPDGWRQFISCDIEKRGCALHPAVSRTTYLDGRVILTENCVSEKYANPS